MSMIETIKAKQQLIEQKRLDRDSLDEEINELNEAIGELVELSGEYEKQAQEREAEIQAAFNTYLVTAKSEPDFEQRFPELRKFAIDAGIDIPDEFTDNPELEHSDDNFRETGT